jgi:23S rRNA (uracil1939-C5)-methyltransferase
MTKQENRKEGHLQKKLICPSAKKCGGCHWLYKPYSVQLAEKDRWVRELLHPFCTPEPIIGMKDPRHYRNKVHAVFGEDQRHRPISGTYEAGTHRIVPVDSCFLENEKASAIIVSIRGLLPSFKIRPYNEDTGYGLLRHVLVRTAHATGEIMVVLVLRSPILPSKNNFVKALLKLHPEITTVILNENNRATSMVLGEKGKVLYGKGYIEDVLCGRTFRISPRSFYQVNPEQTEKLYGEAIRMAALTGKERVVDAYCGIGTLAIIAASHAKEVFGVELSAEAVRDARSNAKRNGVSNVRFYQDDAQIFLETMAQQEKADVLFLDPPRKGSGEEVLAAAVRLAPKKIIYISCHPETLAKDLRHLAKSRYRVEKGAVVDMFPYTQHVETVVLMSKIEK